MEPPEDKWTAYVTFHCMIVLSLHVKHLCFATGLCQNHHWSVVLTEHKHRCLRCLHCAGPDERKTLMYIYWKAAVQDNIKVLSGGISGTLATLRDKLSVRMYLSTE